MLKIRLKRMGRKNRPFYRVVVAEQHKAPQSVYIENLGSFNPRDKEKTLVLKATRIKHWISKGAQVSPVVYNLLVDQKIVEGGKIKATKQNKKGKKEEASAIEKTPKIKQEDKKIPLLKNRVIEQKKAEEKLE